MQTPSHTHWKKLFALWSTQGLIAFLWLILIPTDTSNPIAFGFSPARLLLVAIALLLTAFSAFLWFQLSRPNRQPAWLKLLQQAATCDVIYIGSLFILFVVLAVIVDFKFLPDEAVYLSTMERLQPLLFWFGLSFLEMVLMVGWNRYEKVKSNLNELRPDLKSTFVVILLVGLLGTLVVVTKIGITADENFGDPPVPFFGWQIVLTLIVVGILAFVLRINRKINAGWIPLLIYIVTVLLWLAEPINPAYTATPPRAPNFEIYPFSDPQFYAQYAQSALVGEGFFWPEVPTRPFYVAFLTWLHLLGDQNYYNIIGLQTLVLALFPVLLYLVGQEMGGWPLGVSLALLSAFRDINSNHSALFANNVTYSKLFLSELPTALLISLVTLLTIHWIRSMKRPMWFPLLMGGVLGAATLIRLQSFVLIPVILLVALMTRNSWNHLMRDIFLLLAGFLLTITPWIIRNYYATGGFILDNPISQTMTMARRWSGSWGNEILPQLPGENDAQYSSRLVQVALESFKQNPGFVLRTTANHFVNSEIASLLAFPLRDQLLSPSELLWPEHTFWTTPVTARQMPLFAIYLFLFSLGLGSAWRYHGFIGLLPLGLGVTYNFWSALFFSSGVRFIVPVDWSVQLYQLFGLLIVFGLLLSFTETARQGVFSWLRTLPPEDDSALITPMATKRRFVLSLTAVVLLGGLLPITEFIFPQKYYPISQNEIAQRMKSNIQAGEMVLYGRAIYPRYYESGDGEPGTAKLGYEISEQARLVFYLVGPTNELVIFDLENTPMFFPNSADVYMIGVQQDGYFSPRIVMVSKNDQTEYYDTGKPDGG